MTRRRQVIAALGGTMAAWPLAARTQQATKVPRVGNLITGSASSEAQSGLKAFRQALRELGYIEGQNVVIEYRSADGRIERLPDLVRELIDLKVDVIVAGATPAGRAAHQATKTIPIIVSAMGDPIGDGFVASLARPGGNVTGTTFLGPELVPKRLALLKELLPSASRVAVLWHPGAFGDQTMKEMQKEIGDAAGPLGLQLQFSPAHNLDELDGAFATIAASRPEAIFQFPSPVLYAERRRIVELAAKYRIPAMYNAREFVEAGGLIGYGTNLDELSRRGAMYVDRILKGAKPSELPVEQPNRFELVVNLKTARALGLTIPPSILARADEVIE
jgi:putative ABC transport system substrate-binding protein